MPGEKRSVLDMLSKEVTGNNEEFPEKSCGRHFNDIEHENVSILHEQKS